MQMVSEEKWWKGRAWIWLGPGCQAPEAHGWLFARRLRGIGTVPMPDPQVNGEPEDNFSTLKGSRADFTVEELKNERR